MFNILQKLNSEIIVIWGGWGLITLGKCAKNGLYGITLQPHIRLSQTSPYFVQKVTGIIFKLNYLEKLHLLGV